MISEDGGQANFTQKGGSHIIEKEMRAKFSRSVMCLIGGATRDKR